MSEENISVKTLVTEDMTREELCDYAKHLEEREAELLNINHKLQKKAELGEHYKHLYSEVKKQKDDVVEAIKGILEINNNYSIEKLVPFYSKKWVEDTQSALLRMLGEIDE